MTDQVAEYLEKLAGPYVPVEYAGKLVGLSRGSAYKAVATGELPSVKIGRRIVVPCAPLRKMLGLEPGIAA